MGVRSRAESAFLWDAELQSGWLKITWASADTLACTRRQCGCRCLRVHHTV